MKTPTFIMILLSVAGMQGAFGAIDLLARYPTTLKEEDTAHPREWKFGAEDVFTISGFKFEAGDQLRLDLGESDLGIGHCDDGAVWAVIMPRTRSGLTTQITNIVEPVAHVWLRFAPSQLNELFPSETVSAGAAPELALEMGAIARTKIRNSWQGGGRALIPPPNEFTVDVETWTGIRRFFSVDKNKQEARYVATLEKQITKRPPPITRELAQDCFDKIWTAFDAKYAMFALRPEVDWTAMRDRFRERAIESKSIYAFASVVAEMLRPLRDLHVWLTVAGADIPVFDRPRSANANPLALRSLLPPLQAAGRDIQWAVTDDKVGYALIRGWNDRELPGEFDKLLEQCRDTRALVIDVRLNGGGSETLAREVAGRFVDQEFAYASSQFRNGPKHADLAERQPRRVSPRGPWRYNRPVFLLIGQRCMSSNESFIAMMMGDPEVTTMGDHTTGSSGNPKIIPLPLEMSVSVPQWIDYLPDGTPLDERGIEPKIHFTAAPGDFEGNRDQLLTAALDRARKTESHAKPIKGPFYIPENEIPFGLRTAPVADYSDEVKAESDDTSRPHVVEVNPAPGAENVAVKTELRIRFDRPMNPLALRLDWLAGGFLECGESKYDSNRFEFTIPVRLAHGATHQIMANKDLWGKQQMIVGPLDGFLSTNSERATLFVWNFRTSAASATAASRPRALKIEPPAQGRAHAFQFVEVQFDHDMLPPEDAFPYVISNPRNPELQPELISKVDYDKERRIFRMPLALSPKQKGPFVLAGFRSMDGIPAEPVKINFESIDPKNVEWPKADTNNPALKKLLAEMSEKRATLNSIVEHVQTITTRQRDGLFVSFESKSSEFRWQKPNQFYGEVSAMMGSVKTFIVGFDGTNWWHLNENARTNIFRLCPAADIEERNLSISDPFGLSRAKPEEAAASERLSYMGLRAMDGKKFHAIESWRVESYPDFQPGVSHLTWLIGPESLRVSEVIARYNSSVMRTKFITEAINETIPSSAFAPPSDPKLQPNQAEPLGPQFTHRFINLQDGSDGLMSVRWGKKGPKQTSSSGLN